MGETAAAGAVRTGIPLKGLLGDVGICTVPVGPSEGGENRFEIGTLCTVQKKKKRLQDRNPGFVPG